MIKDLGVPIFLSKTILEIIAYLLTIYSLEPYASIEMSVDVRLGVYKYLKSHVFYFHIISDDSGSQRIQSYSESRSLKTG